MSNKTIKTSGKADEGFYEAIYHNGEPAFLVYDGKEFRVLPIVHENRIRIHPPTKDQYPYEPYEYHEGDTDPKELFNEVKKHYDTFIDTTEDNRIRWTIEVLLTYIQDLFVTVPYEYLVGDEECGKGQKLTIDNYLMYRPLYGVNITSANIHTYFRAQNPGVILEDELKDIHRNADKLNVYLVGYKKGATVPRIDLPRGERKQDFYPVFGFKCCASRFLPQDKNLMSRFIVSHLYPGYPEKDEIEDDDIQKFRMLRNKTLKWRLKVLAKGLQPVEVETKGRTKELWKPLIQAAATIGVGVEELIEQMRTYERERYEDRKSSKSHPVARAVLYAIDNSEDEWIPFRNIWNGIKASTEGEINDYNDNIFHSEEYGDITKTSLGNSLKELFGAEKQRRIINGKTVVCYRFSPDRVERMVRRYICGRFTELLVLPDLGEGTSKGKVKVTCEHIGENNNCSLYSISCSFGNTVKNVSQSEKTKETSNFSQQKEDSEVVSESLVEELSRIKLW